jgi:gas vesicle protein
MEDNSSVKGFLLGVITGGIAGSLLALLYAPKPGAELRGDIRKKSREIIDETGEYIDTAKTRAGEIITEGRRKAEEFIDTTRENVGNLLLHSKEKVTEEGQKVKDAVKSGVDAYKEERSKNTQSQKLRS